MDRLIECLKVCNLKLNDFRTTEFRFVAWIIYSAQDRLFIAGVDVYSNDEQNLQTVVANGMDESAFGAMNQVYRQICTWETDGKVSVLSKPIGV